MQVPPPLAEQLDDKEAKSPCSVTAIAEVTVSFLAIFKKLPVLVTLLVKVVMGLISNMVPVNATESGPALPRFMPIPSRRVRVLMNMPVALLTRPRSIPVPPLLTVPRAIPVPPLAPLPTPLTKFMPTPPVPIVGPDN